MNIDLNEIIISGTINNIMDNNQDYIKFGLTTLKYDKRKVYSSLNINRNLYEIYKDFFVKGTKVFIKGYLNSYSSNNNIKLFITVLDVSDNEDELINGRKGPHIRVDPDGVEVWNGKREEITPPTKEELKEMEDLISEYR
jgi:single-stranded DNA-binding protein